MKRSSILTLVAAAVLSASVATPARAATQDLPSYARAPVQTPQEQQIKGRIKSIDGTFAITVDDEQGYTDNVRLHQGTIINPTGLTLTSGMSVAILGYNAGQWFNANQIDTPYTYDGPAPVPVYYGSGFWYPGYAYGYGPSFSLFLGFGALALTVGPWYGGWYLNPWYAPYAGYRAPWAFNGYYGRPTPYYGYGYGHGYYNNGGYNNGHGNWNGNGNNGQNGMNPGHGESTSAWNRFSAGARQPGTAGYGNVSRGYSNGYSNGYSRGGYSNGGYTNGGYRGASGSYGGSARSGGGYRGGGGYGGGHGGGGGHR